MNQREPISPPGAGNPQLGSRPQVSRLNLPNLLSGTRFLGSFVLVAVAWFDYTMLVIPLFLVLLISDWVDGKLAILWKQQTAFGARLDSLADATFYLATLLALVRLKSELIVAEVVWIVPAAVAYLLSCLVGWIKFRRIPAYHTRAAKTGWLLVGLVVLAVFARDWHWPIRVLAIWVLLVNVEAILISLVLPKSLVDVASLYHAWVARRLVLEQGIATEGSAERQQA
ncbi:MAG: CDP-alcohol phosphatidyltransferase family protein [Pirellulales bacterium]|nr:CDP-alcohol phosphatidyltransferase family protein [Pirellulales bacterium]